MSEIKYASESACFYLVEDISPPPPKKKPCGKIQQLLHPISGMLDYAEDLYRKVKSPSAKRRTAYECCLCGRFCHDLNKVKMHIDMVHTKPTNEICPFCKKIYKNKHTLRAHIRRCTRE